MKLYYHKTDGGAEYYGTTFVTAPNGEKVSDCKNHVLRTDGDELEIFSYERLRKAGFKSVVLPDGTYVNLCPDEKTEPQTDIEKAIEYVRENKNWTDAEERVALDGMNENRCPLDWTLTGQKIRDRIAELMDEYGQDNDLPADWWREQKTEEEIFMEL